MRKTIGWIEQDGPDAYFCWRHSDGRKIEWLLIEMRCRPDGGDGDGKREVPPPIAALKVAA